MTFRSSVKLIVGAVLLAVPFATWAFWKPSADVLSVGFACLLAAVISDVRPHNQQGCRLKARP